MKRFFWVALTAVVAMVVSCQKENNFLTGAGRTTVRLSVVAPSDAQTKTIADGRTVNCVYWAAFDENNDPVDGLAGKEIMSDKTATFDVQLVNDYPYNFVFWAQYEDADGVQDAYDLTAFVSLAKVEVDYEGLANDEYRDAFCKQEIIKINSAGESRTIELRRPFAQINFLAADYKSVEEVEVHKSLKSTVAIDGLPTVLNILDGSVEGSASTVLSATAVPTEYFSLNGEQYGWYSMNYVLAADENRLNAVTATFTHDKSDKPVHIAVPNVPYKRNHRTNIIGNFLTGIAEVKVIVMEGFEDPSYDIDEEGNPIQ